MAVASVVLYQGEGGWSVDDVRVSHWNHNGTVRKRRLFDVGLR